MHRPSAQNAAGYAFVLFTALSNCATAQSGNRQAYVAMSVSVAQSWGQTWALGRHCGVTLDGLSRTSAELLFARRLEQNDLVAALQSYDDAAAQLTPAEACDRAVLNASISRTEALTRRYLQFASPIYPIHIGPSPTPRL